MIMDARAQVDRIAALHLEALFKTGHCDQSNRLARSVTAIPPFNGIRLAAPKIRLAF
jgi:hypothetical protein